MSKDYITIKVKKNDYKSFKSEVLKKKYPNKKYSY